MKIVKTVFKKNEKYFHNFDFSIEIHICQHFPWIFIKNILKIRLFYATVTTHLKAISLSILQ